MKYFQTDDRDDYFNSLKTNNQNKTVSVTLLDPNKKVILTEVPTYKIRTFVKKNYPEFGNAKKIWRKAIESKGYTVINNIN
jgi:hypothetical protein